MNHDILIKLNNVSKIYQTGDIKVEALNHCSLEIKKNQLVVILGPSGAGKTTLLNVLGGMDVISTGELFVDGAPLHKYNDQLLTKYRRNDIGFVFQFYNLMPNLTALENVELATEICKDAKDPKTMLERVGLEKRLHNFPAQLSGGEQQRVSIARALAKNPKLLLCDEPTGALDVKTGKYILSLLQEVVEKDNKTVIIVTHNQALKDIANQVIYIKDGKITDIEYPQNPKAIREISW